MFEKIMGFFWLFSALGIAYEGGPEVAFWSCMVISNVYAVQAFKK